MGEIMKKYFEEEMNLLSIKVGLGENLMINSEMLVAYKKLH